jgi:molecular chaperone DnaK (HSP70)
MSENELIVGIDLGTTNSEIAAFVGDRPQVLGHGKTKMLPSCVGISASGELLVGESAKNQLLVYPEQTVRSIKRKMGSDEKVSLGTKTFTPQEISAIILRELAQWGQKQLNKPVKKAVITVPAYFSDAQRQATREAGELAGLEVVRILNEPTAASLAYGFADDSQRTVMVYDLGGGTFDVSIVTIQGDITEVLASHGNNHLGGDDFDDLLLKRLLEEFQQRNNIDLKDCHPASYSRLRWAAEEAKKKLSYEPYANVREESLATKDGKARHLDIEIARTDYEAMIRPLVESTLESVFKAIQDSSKQADHLDAILLVGGSTRTPLIWKILEERTGIVPRQDVHPDLCVALGAGVLASRLAGLDVNRVLVDVSPYSFGPSYVGDRDGRRYPYCYHPIIKRNTPLPVTKTDSYFTAAPYQKEVEIEIFQGDDPDALKNILVGNFRIEGLTPTPDPNEVMCRMSLDIDGILNVAAIEKCTGKSKHITISNALKQKNEKEMAAAQERLKKLYELRSRDTEATFDAEDEAADNPYDELLDAESQDADDDSGNTETEQNLKFDPQLSQNIQKARELVSRSRVMLEKIHAEDKEEIIDLHEQIEEAISAQDNQSLSSATDELKELLFFIEGK